MHQNSISRPIPVLGLLLSAVVALGLACAPSPPETAGPEILWDSWGVPHIYADDGEDLFYGFGWAQARNHGNLLLRLFGEARGRAAEYWGPEHLEHDRWIHTMGLPRRAERWLAEQDEELAAFLEAFVAGVNDYAATHAEAIADEVEIVLPVTAADVLAHTQRIIHFTFIVGPGAVDGARRHLEAAGSNAWAIGPSRSASGNPILVANPHLPWRDLFTWFETQLVAPGIDAYGAALVGAPFLGIGFNDHLAWTHTVNTHDGADLFELALDGGGYRFDGEVREFEVETVALQALQGDGSLRHEELTVRRSVHGPVVAENGEEALALAVVGLDSSHLLRQYWDMARAQNLEEFEAAMRQMQMPMFTFMYADREGNILHHFGGATPVRPRGDWETWSRPVPGDSSDWTWQGIHPYEELPTVLNPDSGWLQNANDPPWTTTFPRPLEPDDYPPYMAPRFMHLRAQQSADMLASDDSITFQEAVAYKLTTHMKLADRLLDDLAAAVEAHGDAAAREAMTVLESWDRSSDADSRGAVLFLFFAEEMSDAGLGLYTPFEESGFTTGWDPDQPLATPDGLADPAASAAALSRAAAELRARHGALDIAWGEVFHLEDEEHLPANGGPGSLGIFRVVSYGPQGDHLHARSGDSWVAVVELGDPVRAEVLLTYGNASQPGSPHAGDQFRLFSEKRLRPAWRTRAEIEANLAERETPARNR